jgi:hypothetical protein
MRGRQNYVYSPVGHVGILLVDIDLEVAVMVVVRICYISDLQLQMLSSSHGAWMKKIPTMLQPQTFLVTQ